MHVRGSSVVRRDDEDGASLVEYGLLLALIAVVAFSAVSFFGSANNSAFMDSCEQIATASGHTCA